MRLSRKKRTSITAITLVLAMLSPTYALASSDTGNSANLTYRSTERAVIEKANLLTQSYGTTSVQYALMDEGKIVLSGQVG